MAGNVTTVEKCEIDLFCGVNWVKDPDNMTELEMKHVPVITAPRSVGKGERFEVTVEMGKLMEHPNEPGHFIDFIELYAGHTYLARMDFTPKITGPSMTVSVALDHIHGELRAFGHCNLHGTWVGSAEIEITD